LKPHEKLEEAEYFFLTQKYPDAAYTVYSSIIQTAKSYLLKQGVETNSKAQIIESFEPHFEKVAAYLVEDSFLELVDGYIPAQTNLEILTAYLATGKRFHQIINTL
jgi:uncharacterized protein (UPF0332 family)